MIQIKMGELLNCTETLQKLSQKELKSKLAFSIARVLKEADKEIQNFNEVRMNLIKKFGEKDEKGELITDDKDNCKIPPEQVGQFSKELDELVNTEIEINANKFHLNDLEELDFTPTEMIALEPFIDEE